MRRTMLLVGWSVCVVGKEEGRGRVREGGEGVGALRKNKKQERKNKNAVANTDHTRHTYIQHCTVLPTVQKHATQWSHTLPCLASRNYLPTLKLNSTMHGPCSICCHARFSSFLFSFFSKAFLLFKCTFSSLFPSRFPFFFSLSLGTTTTTPSLSTFSLPSSSSYSPQPQHSMRRGCSSSGTSNEQ